MINLTPITITVRAPRVFVFRCLTDFGAGSPAWSPANPELVERTGSVLTVRRRRRVNGRTAPVLERVRIHPPEVIGIEMVEGPLREMHETVTLVAADGSTTALEVRTQVSVGDGRAARLVERWVTGPMMTRELRREVGRWRVVIEAAARASGLNDPVPEEEVEPST